MDAASTIVIPDNPKEIKAAISQMLAQIDEIRAQMKVSDADMARLDTQYAASRAETLTLREETESILAHLRETL